jgi:superfamily II DNA or RNA helicase
MKRRYYQKDCKTAIQSLWNEGLNKLAAVLPTGGGKTFIFGDIIKDYLRDNPNEKVVVVSHLSILTTQNTERFKKDWDINADILQAQRMPAADARCIITTMQSFSNEDKVNLWRSQGSFWKFDPMDVGLIVVDEAHRMGSVSYTRIQDNFPDAKILGFTATPFRSNKLMTDMFDRVAYTISMQELIDKKFLVPPQLNHVPFDTSDTASMYGNMVNIYKERHDGEKAVIYVKTIEEAELLRNIFVDSGIGASAVTSKLTGAARDNLLEEFRNGRGPEVLTTVDVLTAGFDSPNIKAIFMPYKVSSVTTYLQRVGRGLRTYEGKTHCDLYVGATSPNIEKGFWEKITKQMLNQGRTDYDNFLDIMEFGENDYSAEQYTWTLDVVAMAKDVREKGGNRLHDMIVNMDFPNDMLNCFVECPPVLVGSKTKPASAGQVKYVEGLIKRKINGSLSAAEATAIINSFRKASGKVPPEEFVPSGKHKGKLYFEVPWAYWSVLKKKDRGNYLLRKYNALRASKGLKVI